MRIIIKGTNIKLPEDLKRFIEEKIGGLEKFLEDVLKKEDVLDGSYARSEAFVEVGKPSKHHQRGPVFYAECQISLTGGGVRAEAERDDLKLAICEVKDELQRQLEKYRGTQQQKAERGERRAKKDLKLSRAARFYRKGRIRDEGI